MRDLLLITNQQLTTETLFPLIERVTSVANSSTNQIMCGKTPKTVNIFLPSKSSNDAESINIDGTRIYEEDGWITYVEYRLSSAMKKVVRAIMEIDPNMLVIDENDNLVSASKYLDMEFDY